ncbi:MAG: hypothetical protein ACTSQA_03315 [Candidatus Heimdallarchaeaceae archaeon]
MNLEEAIKWAERDNTSLFGKGGGSTLVYYVCRWNDEYVVNSNSYMDRHPDVEWIYNTRDKKIIMEKTVIIEGWVESEAGWGTRPDGATIHLTKEDSENYIAGYWDTMPDKTPSEYSRPNGVTKVAKVSDDLYKRVKATENGLDLHQSDYVELLKEDIEFIL